MKFYKMVAHNPWCNQLVNLHHWKLSNVHSSSNFFSSVFLLSLRFCVTIVTWYGDPEVTLRYLRHSTN